MTPRYTKALGLGARAQEGQVRKGTTIPYITHPLAVAALVAQYGGDEDRHIAALFHDILEDGGSHYSDEVARAFGRGVLTIIKVCTDGTPDATGRKPPWNERKLTHLEHLRNASDDALLVSGCEKLSNARNILDDFEVVGPPVFDRLRASKQETLWYYSELAKAFEERQTPICKELTATVAEMHRIASNSAKRPH